MFNNLDPKNKDIDDIFADTDAPLAAAPVAPMAPRPAVKAPMVSTMPRAVDLGEEVGTKSKMGRVLKKLLIFIIILVLIGATAYFIYAKFLINNFNNSANIVDISAPKIPAATTSIDLVPTSMVATTTLTTTTVINLDPDNDGLSDTGEAVLGTNPNNIDTDGDGLTDGDEVKKYLTSPILKDTDSDGLTDGEEINTYKTDANNPDTDGDTYSDGSEVKAGYDPLQKPVK